MTFLCHHLRDSGHVWEVVMEHCSSPYVCFHCDLTYTTSSTPAQRHSFIHVSSAACTDMVASWLRRKVVRGLETDSVNGGSSVALRVCAHCGTHFRVGGERGQGDRVDRVRRAANLERRRCVTRRCQEDEAERTTHWLPASNVDRCSRP